LSGRNPYSSSPYNTRNTRNKRAPTYCNTRTPILQLVGAVILALSSSPSMLNQTATLLCDIPRLPTCCNILLHTATRLRSTPHLLPSCTLTSPSNTHTHARTYTLSLFPHPTFLHPNSLPSSHLISTALLTPHPQPTICRVAQTVGDELPNRTHSNTQQHIDTVCSIFIASLYSIHHTIFITFYPSHSTHHTLFITLYSLYVRE